MTKENLNLNRPVSCALFPLIMALQSTSLIFLCVRLITISAAVSLVHSSGGNNKSDLEANFSSTKGSAQETDPRLKGCRAADKKIKTELFRH